MEKQTILTGLRANNDLHIGNYFGALLPLIQMARERSDDYTVNLFVPDLHSFTTPIDHSKLQEQIIHNLRIFAAAGLPLDNDSINIYRQSYIPAHSELTWILDCFTRMGDLGRMTQFKDKSKKIIDENQRQFSKIAAALGSAPVVDRRSELKNLFNILNDTGKTHIADQIKSIYEGLVQEKHNDLKKMLELYEKLKYNSIGRAEVPVGLFNYPVLMAADILLYGASYVPVGDDQSQHLEFARNIAERMNNKFGELFTVPVAVKDQHAFFGKEQGLRIKDLVDPTKKMSKSDDTGKGIIFLGDDPDEAARKIMSATTDNLGVVNYKPETQPGISNLLQIHALLSGEPLDEVIAHHEGGERYGDLKKEVAEQVKAFLTDFQAKLAEVDDAKLLEKLEASEQAMNGVANETLLRVQKAVGLRV